MTYEFIYLCLKIQSNKITNEINYFAFVLNTLFTSGKNYLKPVTIFFKLRSLPGNFKCLKNNCDLLK